MRLFGILILSLGFWACNTPDPPQTLTYLAPLLPVAEIASEWRPPRVKHPVFGANEVEGDWIKNPAPETGVLALGEAIQFRFQAISQTEREILIEITSAEPKAIKLALNGQFLQSLQISEKVSLFRLAIPSALLKQGRNTLSLAPAKGLRIHDFALTLKGGEKPSTKVLPAKKKLDWSQPPGSNISFSLAVEPGATLEFGWRPSMAQASIWLERPESLPIKIWSPDQKIRPLPLNSGAKPERIRLIFRVDGPPEGYGMQWKVPCIRGLSEDPPPAPPAFASAGQPAQPQPAKVVVVALMDASAARRFGAYGSARGVTPHFDRLTKESIQLCQAYTQSSWTLPAIASLFTGFYPFTHQVSHFQHKLPETFLTLAEQAKQQGYQTLLLSQHPGVRGANRIDQGFDQSQKLEPGLDLLRAALQEMLPEKPPLFLYLHLLPPHSPYTPPKPYLEAITTAPYHGQVRGQESELARIRDRMFDLEPSDIQRLQDLYDANLMYADRLLGEAYAVLAERGLAQDAAWIILGDHGEALYEHKKIWHGEVVYDEVSRVPVLLRLPSGQARLETGIREAIDLHATLQSLLGLPADAARGIFSPTHEAALTVFQQRGAMQGGAMFALRQPPYTYIYSSLPPQHELYNHLLDPGETHNLAAKEPALAQALHTRLTSLLAHHVALGNSLEDLQTAPDDPKLQEELRALGYVE